MAKQKDNAIENISPNSSVIAENIKVYTYYASGCGNRNICVSVFRISNDE